MQITNVQVANDAREVKRRKDEVATREKRLERLEDQANESVEKFNVVNSRWKIFLESNDPLDLHRDMEEQKGKSVLFNFLHNIPDISITGNCYTLTEREERGKMRNYFVPFVQSGWM